MKHPIRVLFLCTGNSCRSQMAEALLRFHGKDRFHVSSAGSHPAGFIHPLALEALRRMNIPLHDARSKSWNDCLDASVDVVITLCDAAAGEPCPTFPGDPIRVHWSHPDPVYYLGDDEQRLLFALLVAQRIETKIQALIALDWSAPREQLQQRLRFLGEI